MRLLIATGGSPYDAVRVGVDFVRRAGETPTLLTVVRSEGERPRAEAMLAAAQELLRADAPKVEKKVRIGRPSREISSEALEGNYDLVIVDRRSGRSPVDRLLRGSTAQRVVECTDRPVLVAQGRILPIRHILLCDSGAHSARLLDTTATVVDLIGQELEITVLHVMSQMSVDPGIDGEELDATAEELIEGHTPEGEMLADDVEALELEHVTPHPKVRHGVVVEEILEEASGYDLVVIGAYRGEGWQRILLDDLTRKILREVDRPVLVVR
ncbi:MAG: universal stress protein [Anaerolineae bacterium]|jgi:nucleotide-binding universal stress UspA family protein